MKPFGREKRDRFDRLPASRAIGPLWGIAPLRQQSEDYNTQREPTGLYQKKKIWRERERERWNVRIGLMLFSPGVVNQFGFVRSAKRGRDSYIFGVGGLFFSILYEPSNPSLLLLLIVPLEFDMHLLYRHGTSGYFSFASFLPLLKLLYNTD